MTSWYFSEYWGCFISDDSLDRVEFNNGIMHRYLGLPVMLKAGEYSPNNPLVRGIRPAGDVLLGLGEYERRRDTLRKIRQQQYREYLDQQAKLKQEAKEQAERELREREEKERQREEEREQARQRIEEERERQRQQAEEERERARQNERRARVCYVPDSQAKGAVGRKVDTAVQVGISRPLSVAVQTEDADLYRISDPSKSQLTQAERELSPRTVVDQDERPIHPANWAKGVWDKQRCDDTRWSGGGEGENGKEEGRWNGKDWDSQVGSENRVRKAVVGEHEGEKASGHCLRRRSYGDFDERSSSVKRVSRERLLSDLRHSYMPSIFDADAVHKRNLQAEKEAVERRQFYQQELRNQILEQQRIREERKTREKMLELAEMRRLEEQLRMLRAAQERETGRQAGITDTMKENASEFERKRTTLQKEIDFEQRKLRPKCYTALEDTSKLPHFTYDTSKLPHFTPRQEKRPPFSTNIPDSSIFSPNYDVDSYLRKNLNPKKETLMNFDLNRDKLNFKNKVGLSRNTEASSDNIGLRDKIGLNTQKVDLNVNKNSLNEDKLDLNGDKTNLNSEKHSDNVIIEKAMIHERPKDKDKRYEPSSLRNPNEIQDDTPIPVLRHSPPSFSASDELVEGMKLVENKWKVPAVQKNILKSLPNEEGKNVSILTQLGSIRRQLQLEQLRLDNIMSKSD